MAKPNRLAYRWVKELEGWIPSTVAPNTWNGNVEADACEAGGKAEHDLFPLAADDLEVPLYDRAVVYQACETELRQCFGRHRPSARGQHQTRG